MISRESAAVYDWKENSDASFHVMRDHPSQLQFIPPGQFGFRRYGSQIDEPTLSNFVKATYEKMMMASKQFKDDEEGHIEKTVLEAFFWEKIT